MNARRLFWAIWESGPGMVQITVALNAVGMGLIFLDGRPTFPTSQSFRWLAAHGTEAQWGALFLVVGVIGLCGVFGRSIHVRCFAALVGSLQTGLLAWTYYLSNPESPAYLTYGLLTLLSYWLLWHRTYRHA